MIQKPLNVPHISKEMLDALDVLFPERTPEINMDMKEIYFRIGQRSVVRFLHQQKKEQDNNIMEKS